MVQSIVSKVICRRTHEFANASLTDCQSTKFIHLQTVGETLVVCGVEKVLTTLEELATSAHVSDLIVLCHTSSRLDLTTDHSSEFTETRKLQCTMPLGIVGLLQAESDGVEYSELTHASYSVAGVTW